MQFFVAVQSTDDFIVFHDTLPWLNKPRSFDITRALVITTHAMEQQSADVRRFMKHLRKTGARIKTCGDI